MVKGCYTKQILLACTSVLSINFSWAATIDVLWYTYADTASEYMSTITSISANAHTYVDGSGLAWNLSFWRPGDTTTPNFIDYDVLAIHSGEAWRTNPNPESPYAIPDYSGILDNSVGIEVARGDRTFLTGADADFHAVRGDSGHCPGDGCGLWDGALGHMVNAVNWAANGDGLGIVSFLDGEFDGSYWWENENSFLKNELQGYVTYFKGTHGTREDSPLIPSEAAAHPSNQGLSSLGLSDWTWSFHAGFSDGDPLTSGIPGYTEIVHSDLGAGYAAAIATMAPVPIPAAFWLFGSALGLLGWMKRRRDN
jgi:hypothetical protein